MSRLITVFGSPGSGKTTLALAMAGRLACAKNNVVLISSDKVVPNMRVLLPTVDTDKTRSMGALLMQSDLTQKIIAPKLVFHPESDFLACMALCSGDNPISYPPLFDPGKIMAFLNILSGLADYIIVDGTSNPATDSVTLTALEACEDVICTLTPDRKGIEYLSAILAVLKRVPGWSDVLDTIAVTGVEFSADGGTVTARADTTKEGATISGIYVGGKMYEGNPVTCSVPTGAKTLTFQAQDSAGDLSPEITRRVPGWSETIDGITVISVEVSADRSAAVAVAQAKTGASAVAGIYINDTLISGNPVKYAIPRGTQTLRVQAVNTDGDRSEIVTKEVFSDKENSKKTTISITHPGWSNRKKDVRVKISAKNSGTGVDELTATTDEDDSWVDVLDDGYITLTDNSTVTAVAVSGDGNETKKSRYIEWLDDVAPLVNASISEGKAQIVASDKLSGISALYVNGQAFEAGELDRGSLLYSIPAGVTKLTVQAEDVAGNRSRTVELMVKPEEKLPERPIAPLRVPPASVVKTSATDDNSEEQAATDLSDDEARRAELLRLLEEKRKGRVELTADSTVDLTTLEDTDLPLGSMEVEEYTMKEPRIAVLIACALAFWALVVIVILLILHKRKNDSAYDDSIYEEE